MKKYFFYHIPAFDFPEEIGTILSGDGDDRHQIRKLNCLKYLSLMADDDMTEKKHAREALQQRNKIVIDKLPMVEKMLQRNDEEMIAESHLWLINAIERFDYRQNNEFDHFLTSLIRRNAKHWYAKRLKDVGRYILIPKKHWDIMEDDEIQDWNFIEKRINDLKDYINTLEGDAASVVLMRLGLNDSGMAYFDEIGEKHGKSHEWARKLFDKSMHELFGFTLSKSDLLKCR